MSKVRDLTGMKFGRLTVVSELPERYRAPSGSTFVKWHCRCKCGQEVDVVGTLLTSNKVISCGCYQKAIFARPSKYDLKGRRFGKLQVLERLPDFFVFPSGQKALQYRCKCDCGNDFVTLERALLNGSARSCGCTWRCHIK